MTAFTTVDMSKFAPSAESPRGSNILCDIVICLLINKMVPLVITQTFFSDVRFSYDKSFAMLSPQSRDLYNDLQIKLLTIASRSHMFALISPMIETAHSFLWIKFQFDSVFCLHSSAFSTNR